MRWLWIDRILELVPRQRLVAIKNVSLNEDWALPASAGARPGSPAGTGPIFPASLMLEGMAQTAGILVGHAEDFREKVILAKISSATIAADAVPGITLRYTARLQRLDRAGAAATGTIERLDLAAGAPPVLIGSAELIFSHLDSNLAGLEFPEHNFVFGESFRLLLRTSGSVL